MGACVYHHKQAVTLVGANSKAYWKQPLGQPDNAVWYWKEYSIHVAAAAAAVQGNFAGSTPAQSKVHNNRKHD